VSGSGTNHWKLGVFVVATASLGLGILFWVAARRFGSETVERVTYFEESVQGLEIGAPVKVRGVPIGSVAGIRIAPDGKLVEVRARIKTEDLRRLGLPVGHLTAPPDAPRPDSAVGEGDLAASGPEGEALALESRLRLSISTTGITGVKFIEADYVAPSTPTPRLSFTPPVNYIPSAASTLASLEGAARGIGVELPKTLIEMRRLAETLEARVAAVDSDALQTRTLAMLEAAERLLSSAEGVVTKLGPSGDDLVAKLALLVDDGRTIATTVRALVDRMVQPEGPVERAATSLVSLANDAGQLVDVAKGMLESSALPETTASIRGTTVSIGDAAASFQTLARDLQPAATELRATLTDLRAALRKVEELAGYLERDPGALLRGRSEGGR